MPAEPKIFAQALDKLFAFARAFGARDFDSAAVSPFYREALADVPEIALGAAIAAAVRTWKWPGLPKPADLRELAEPTWKLLRANQGRIYTARLALSHRGRH